MARVRSIEIEGYRSICDPVCIRFPDAAPVVMVGENNAGKSNIVRAVDLLLGDRWPGSYSPEDHDYFGRRCGDTSIIRITADVDDVGHLYYERLERVDQFELTYASGQAGGEFIAHLATGQAARMSNAIREQVNCLVIGADRRLGYQLSYASGWTMLSKLMKRFHRALMADTDRADRLKTHFETLHGMFREVSEFRAFASQLEEEVARLSTNLRYGLDIDFSAYDPSNMFNALRVQPRFGSERLAFDELGTGQEQILALAFAYAYARAFGSDAGLLLVVEEPEAHLHPLAQEWLASQLGGFVEAGAQVLITTHSPAFVDVRGLNGMVVVRKDLADGTFTKQVGRSELRRFCIERGAPARVEAETILEFYDAAATTAVKQGFFARAVVLVEGPTEALALPVLLRKHGVELAKLGVAVVPVGGKGNLAKWWRLFGAYEIPTFVIFDNDSNEDGSGRFRRDALTTIGVDAVEQDELLGASALVVRPVLAVFGKDFEHTMRDLVPGYVHLEEQGRKVVGANKPLLARWVAERIELNGELSALATAVTALAPQAEVPERLPAAAEMSSEDPWNVGESDDPFDDIVTGSADEPPF